MDISLRKIFDRVSFAHSNAKLGYVAELVNDCLSELSRYNQNRLFIKIDTVSGQRFYPISKTIEIEKIHNVYYQNTDGNYKKIARYINAEDQNSMDGV